MKTRLLMGLIGAGALAIGWYHWGQGSAEPAPKAVATKSKVTGLSACKSVTFDGSRFTHCIASPAKHRIAMAVTGKDGMLYRGFARLKAERGDSGIAFAMNGGMYDLKSRPIGYYVENGERLHKLSRSKGSGNFHLMPNGVFFGDADGQWRVMTSDDFAAQITKRPQFGTQSGPMLLIDGKLHPEFTEDGPSRKIRNGVGVDAKGRAHFVISDDPVSFGKMARMMRDVARTPNALFLDGTVSALWDPKTDRLDNLYPLGPLIVVTNRTKDEGL